MVGHTFFRNQHDHLWTQWFHIRLNQLDLHSRSQNYEKATHFPRSSFYRKEIALTKSSNLGHMDLFSFLLFKAIVLCSFLFFSSFFKIVSMFLCMLLGVLDFGLWKFWLFLQNGCQYLWGTISPLHRKTVRVDWGVGHPFILEECRRRCTVRESWFHAISVAGCWWAVRHSVTDKE